MAVTCQVAPAGSSPISTGSNPGSAGMPDSTPITKLRSGWPRYSPARRYISTQRTMPTSKHSNSGSAPVSAIASRKAFTFSTGLSNSIGGQAQRPSPRTLR